MSRKSTKDVQPTPISGELIRASDGTFVAAGPGRPKGSKNKVTLFKLQAEEAFRERNEERIDLVLDMILASALDGDKGAQKLVWDSCMSKAVSLDDKNAAASQKITVHRMTVNKSDTPSTTIED